MFEEIQEWEYIASALYFVKLRKNCFCKESSFVTGDSIKDLTAIVTPQCMIASSFCEGEDERCVPCWQILLTKSSSQPFRLFLLFNDLNFSRKSFPLKHSDLSELYD